MVLTSRTFLVSSSSGLHFVLKAVAGEKSYDHFEYWEKDAQPGH